MGCGASSAAIAAPPTGPLPTATPQPPAAIAEDDAAPPPPVPPPPASPAQQRRERLVAMRDQRRLAAEPTASQPPPPPPPPRFAIEELKDVMTMDDRTRAVVRDKLSRLQHNQDCDTEPLLRLDLWADDAPLLCCPAVRGSTMSRPGRCVQPARDCVERFLSGGVERVLLVTGGAGAGKSTLLRQAHMSCWQRGKVLPLALDLASGVPHRDLLASPQLLAPLVLGQMTVAEVGCCFFSLMFSCLALLPRPCPPLCPRVCLSVSLARMPCLPHSFFLLAGSLPPPRVHEGEREREQHNAQTESERDPRTQGMVEF